MTILALDLGTTTGWAIKTDSGIVSGSQSFKPSRFEGGGMRYLKFRKWLTDVKAANSDAITAVYYEEVRRHVSTDSAHAYGGFMAHLTAWCEHHAIPYQGIPVGTNKANWTGKGNATKEVMIAEAVKRGFAPCDDNEADAIALLHYAIKHHEVNNA